jgi:hypothetical protein
MEKFQLYQNKIKEIVNNTTISSKSIFEFDEYTPYADELDFIFNFYTDTLNRSKHNLTPNGIFFNEKRTINAGADKIDDYYIITFNLGLIRSLTDNFKESNFILDKNFQDFETDLGISIKEFMYEYCIHFAFYHEMAHLVQKSDYLNLGLLEHLDGQDDYSEEKHLLELDADEFGTLHLGGHLLQYIENLEREFEKILTQEQLESLLVLSCSTIILYWYTFPSNRKTIHYERLSHPHTSIRTLAMIFTLIPYIRKGLKLKKIANFTINSNTILDKTLAFCTSISPNFFDGKDPIKPLMENIKTERDEIMNYLKKFQQLKQNNELLAVYKWNKSLSS